MKQNKTKAITSALMHRSLLKGHLFFPNIFYKNLECDLLEINKASGFTTEYEVKVSKADYKKDKFKTLKEYNDQDHITIVNEVPKSQVLKKGQRVNYFYYVVPEGLVEVDEIPYYAGLIYACLNKSGLSSSIHSVTFKLAKKAPKLSKNKIAPEDRAYCFEKMYYRNIKNIING